MYCMRWFIPLLLLPFPNAPPIFTLLFLVSFFLHQRPCVYCTILLVALFTSTCYWGAGRCWLDLNNMNLLAPIRTGAPSAAAASPEASCSSHGTGPYSSYYSFALPLASSVLGGVGGHAANSVGSVVVAPAAAAAGTNVGEGTSA
ncbi:hypothetical protein BC936DRAFT_148172 [Jimgerdemannia flammicorona]|uniref:Uncharacterized protein n=1 Tax=Jimgerdemannia flammicorona TaxID=994334 RepID=A0A433D3Q8_9FUNG|nr:hypothetical protein BC936DRAFT_148172 [Jimgerdemannia flammicorona]